MTVRELLDSVLREADHEDDILVTFNLSSEARPSKGENNE